MNAFVRSGPLAILCLIASIGVACAQSPPARLETRLDHPARIWAGQRLDLQITLYTRGVFSGVPRFDLPEDSGMVLVREDSRPLLGSREIDGADYLSKQYSIAVFPLRPGALQLPAFDVEFAYRDENRNEVAVTLSTTAQRFEVQPVPGADPGLPLLTSTDLDVSDHWDRQPVEARVGEAFTRTLTLTAEGLPGMVLPPLHPVGAEGLAIYPEPPRVSTETGRGVFIGKRQERYSYVLEQPGHYTLPAMKLQWWNPRTETLTEVRIEGINFDVSPDPLLQSPAAIGATDQPDLFMGRYRAVLAATLTGGLIFGLLIVLRRKRQSRVGGDLSETEALAFRRFRQATAANDAAASLRTLMRWLDVTGLGGKNTMLGAFVQSTGDPALAAQINRLERHLFGRATEDASKRWSGKALNRAVARARNAQRKKRSGRHFDSGNSLCPLNPETPGRTGIL